MDNLYVLSVGGSGARVLRSLVMLLSAGVDMGRLKKIVPIIIDTDSGGGNLEDSVDLIKRYQRLRKHFWIAGTSAFSVEIAEPDGGFVLPLDGVDQKTFAQYIGYQAMSRESQNLIQCLFDPEKDLKMELRVGFKGKPSMGGIVFEQLQRNPNYINWIQDINQNPADNGLFIISSIFGGTGASGFPAIIKSIRSQQGAIAQSHIGSLSILPYFTLKPNPESTIDPASFYAKSRSALKYYLHNLLGDNSLDSHYWIGDSKMAIYDNHEGGKKQNNPAYYVELVGAMMLRHYAIKTNPQQRPSRCQEYEYGLDAPQDETQITFKHLGVDDRSKLAPALTSLYLAYRYLNHYDVLDSSSTPQPWLKDVHNQLDPTLLGELKEHLAAYIQWLREMSTADGRRFAPITIDQEVDELYSSVKDYEIKKGFFGGLLSSKPINDFTERLNKRKPNGNLNQEQAHHHLLKVLTEVGRDIAAEEIKLK